ncbi:hypothetical protein BAE44_0020269 [Dichanthelium oligosanthes]|uniref:DC1 domain-containing protein n=1 Tax=Dichanthelium oligosanthes TaxID=888268 RepID=A0A1E5V0N8_9POAL|nr:hypothetical protein BAE44_0020269 [Dichanthelium oligosanthes]
MGASFSVSGGHFSRREHGARFTKRVSDSRPCPSASTCGMCQRAIDFDAPAYRCSEPGCPFLLHDDCYRRPETVKGHLGRPYHQLTLGPPAARRACCSLCAKPLGAPAFAYACADCDFRAHPRCRGLSPDVSAQHEHGRLVLRFPSGGDTIDDARRPGQHHRRSCLDCRKTTSSRTAACSYQCPAPACDKELCLRCVMRNNERPAPRSVFYFGEVVGLFIKGILRGMGVPTSFIPMHGLIDNKRPRRKRNTIPRHSSHPEHSARFKRVNGGNRSPSSRCRMCQVSVGVGEVAYLCSEPDCSVVLHEACYRRPMTLKRHFGHPKHRLTLGGDTRSGLSCSLCGQGLGTPPVAYSCTSSRFALTRTKLRSCPFVPIYTNQCSAWRAKRKAKHLPRSVQIDQIISCGTAYVRYSCTRCQGFFIHADCFHRQETIEGHPTHPSHPLTLSGDHRHQITGAGGPRSCTLCAGGFDPPTAFVYGCSRTDCHGFYAHPACCDLPHKLTTALHQHDLTLLSPPHHHGRPIRSTCLNRKCRNKISEAWSYQCLPCKVHLCLACQEEDDSEGRHHRLHRGCDWNVGNRFSQIYAK